MEDTNRKIGDMSNRVSVIERAFFGTIDEATNQFIPGLLQNTESVAKSSADNAAETKEVKRWMRIAVFVGLAFVLLAAFPRLAEAFKIAMALAGG